jgi:hypothetical protein
VRALAGAREPRRSTVSALRIAIDIDSTLHHYWDQLSAVAKHRFGVDLPYEEQMSWGVDGDRIRNSRSPAPILHIGSSSSG